MSRGKEPKEQTSFSIKDREIYINGWISEKTLIVVTKAIVYMQRYSCNPIIVIIGHSIGGCAICGLMIYTILRNAVALVHTIVERRAESAAFIVFLAGKKRIMLRGSYVYPHWTEVGHPKDTRHNVVELKNELLYALQVNERVYQIIKQKTRLSQEEILFLCANRVPINSARAKKLKVATHIASRKLFYSKKKPSRKKII